MRRILLVSWQSLFLKWDSDAKKRVTDRMHLIHAKIETEYFVLFSVWLCRPISMNRFFSNLSTIYCWKLANYSRTRTPFIRHRTIRFASVRLVDIVVIVFVVFSCLACTYANQGTAKPETVMPSTAQASASSDMKYSFAWSSSSCKSQSGVRLARFSVRSRRFKPNQQHSF